jgi:DNA-binding transcriptional MerR regulator
LAVDGASRSFTIGEVSRATGLTPQVLRQWESKRLISPQRTKAGYRIYGEADVERLRKIKHLRKVEELNFAAIHKYLGPMYTEPEANGEVEKPAQARTKPLGDRLRRRRRAARQTLQDVSEATGLSVSFISTIERGYSGASVASLKRLADHYGVTMRAIFGADIEQNSPLVQRGEGPVMRWENGVHFEVMAPGDKVMDTWLLRVPARTGSEGFYSHDGEEFFYGVSGILFVELKGYGSYAVGPGAVLYFDSTTPHRWWAEEEAAEALSVNTPPTF